MPNERIALEAVLAALRAIGAALGAAHHNASAADAGLGIGHGFHRVPLLAAPDTVSHTGEVAEGAGGEEVIHEQGALLGAAHLNRHDVAEDGDDDLDPHIEAFVAVRAPVLVMQSVQLHPGEVLVQVGLAVELYGQGADDDGAGNGEAPRRPPVHAVAEDVDRGRRAQLPHMVVHIDV